MSGELRCLARGDAVTSWLVELDKIFITITIWAGLGWADQSKSDSEKKKFYTLINSAS